MRKMVFVLFRYFSILLNNTKFGFLFGVFYLILQPIFNSKAQSLKDTLLLQTIQIEGSKSILKSSSPKAEIDSSILARSITLRLSELLSQNTPIFIKEYGRGAMATASFRGTAPSHTKVDWNGLELNSPMLGMVDFSLIPVYFTEEVKLLQGSSSLLESSGALGGTILLENKANWNNTFTGKLISGYGSYQTFDEYAQINIGNKKIQSRSALFYNASQNDFPFINKLNATIDPVTGGYIYETERNKNADYLNYGLLQEVYLQSGPNNTLSLKLWLQHNDRSIPQLLTNESDVSANINRQTEDALRSVAEWKRFGTQSRLSILSAISLQNSTYLLENRVSGAPNLVALDANSQVFSFVNKIAWQSQLNSMLSIASGLDVVQDHVNSENRNETEAATGYNKNRNNSSVYAKIDFQMNTSLNAYFLIREELIDLKHAALLPLLRFTDHPIPDKKFAVTGSLAENSHPPTLNDLYYLPGGNPNLLPEKGILADMGVTDEFSIGINRLHAGISLFHSNIHNWIIWLPTFQGYWEPSNISRVRSQGIEANISWVGYYRSVRYGVKGNYAFTATENRTVNSPAYGNQLPYIPKHSANLNFDFSWSLFYIDWIWNYYSKRYTTTANSEETYSDYLYPYLMNNIQLGMKIPVKTNSLSAECKVLNIFNEDYRTVLQRPMPGRNYQLVLRYDF